MLPSPAAGPAGGERSGPSWLFSERLIKAERVAVFMRGASSNNNITQVLHELHALKKPNSRYLAERAEGGRLQSSNHLEKVCGTHGASMFGAASHTKRRQNHLTLGRLYNGKVLDQFGLTVTSSPDTHGSAERGTVGSTPCFVFLGKEWQADRRLSEFKNLVIDCFGIRLSGRVGITGVERAIVCAALNRTHLTFSQYLVHGGSDLETGGGVKLVPSLPNLVMELASGGTSLADVTAMRTALGLSDASSKLAKERKRERKNKAHLVRRDKLLSTKAEDLRSKGITPTGEMLEEYATKERAGMRKVFFTGISKSSTGKPLAGRR